MKIDSRNKFSAVPALKSIPNEIEQAPLSERDIGTSQTPCESVLDRKANMPGQATPANDTGKQRYNQTRDYHDSHGLTH